MIAGALVEYTDALCNRIRGVVDRVDETGRVYICTRQVNRYGRRRARRVIIWFDAHEVDRLRLIEDPT